MRRLVAGYVAASLLLSSALGVLIGNAVARDEGRYGGSDPVIKQWIRGLTDKGGHSCCDTADGYPAEVEWDTASNRYRVRIGGEWFVVPDEAVITQPNKLGYAMVWFQMSADVNGKNTPFIRCFIAGAGG